jgi:type IV pilus assembly protein PilY1
MKRARNLSLAGFLFAALAGVIGAGHAAMTVPASPLTVGASVPTIVMLNITKDQNLYQKAYNDYTDLDLPTDGVLETTYKHDINYYGQPGNYYGYFDSFKCYTYTSGVFVPVARTSYTTMPTDCAGNWHGNFLNWVSMTRMDVIRKLLYGGLRVTPEAAGTATVLERAYVPTDAHAWVKYYNPDIAIKLDQSGASAGVLAARYPPIGNLTPFGSTTTTTPTAVTSTTNNTIGGSQATPAIKTFTVASTAGFSYGDQVLIEDGSCPTLPTTTPCSNYMIGAVSCVNGTGITMYDGLASGASTACGSSGSNKISVVVENSVGSGTPTSWKIYDWAQTGLSICNATLGASGTQSQANTNPPLMRVAAGNFSLWSANERWQCYWREDAPDEETTAVSNAKATNGNRAALSGLYASSLGPNQTTVSAGRVKNGLSTYDYNVRVQACVSSALGNEKCEAYPNGDYRPIGLLQYYGEPGLLRFGLMTGSYVKNKSGGVLRKNVGDLTNEVNTTTDGTFKAAPATGGIINTLNKLRIYGYIYGSGKGTYRSQDGSSDDCTWQQTDLTEGKCLSWGNPMSEIYLESLRYLAGKSANFSADDTTKITGLSTATWVDPLSATNYCARLNVLNLNSNAPSYDTDQMAGAADIGCDANAETTQVGIKEGINGHSWFIGNDGNAPYNLCSARNIDLGSSSVKGICPEGSGTDGGYLMAGVARYAHTNRIRTPPASWSVPTSDVDTTSLKVNTFGVALSTNRASIPITDPGLSKTVTLIPVARLDMGSNKFGGGTLVDFKLVCQIPFNATTATVAAVTKDSAGLCSAAGSGAFYVNWEDSEQGGDYDQDMWGRIRYQINDATHITITTDVVAMSTNMPMGFGYSISGTANNKDGPHFHSGIGTSSTAGGFVYTDPANISVCLASATTLASGCPTPVVVAPHIGASGGCNGCLDPDAATSVTYTVGTVANQVLQDPLWYAAKYGGFTDDCIVPPGSPDGTTCTPTHWPDVAYKWDSKRSDGTTTGCSSGTNTSCDSVPDNFFLVTNPNALEDSINTAFQAMLNSSSSSSVATNSTSLRTGSRIYQARYNPNDWSGQVRAFDLDPTTGSIFQNELPDNPYWDAGKDIPGSRNIVTYSPTSNGGIPFTWGAISALSETGLVQGKKLTDWLNMNESGVADSAGNLLGSSRLTYLRGECSTIPRTACNEGKAATNWRERPNSVLGDIVNSTPVYVGVPDVGWASASYATFRQTNLLREPMLYTGANDGMLHGFDVATGAEKIAYVPSAAYFDPVSAGQPGLVKLTGQHYAHKYFVDGTPMVNDVEISDTWKTYLVGGLNWGGRGFYALDITDPTKFSEGNASTIVKWEFTNTNPAENDLGFTYTQPTYPPLKGTSQQIVKMHNNRWAVIVGNGYPGATTNNTGSGSPTGNAALYIIFLDHTGSTWTSGTDYVKLMAAGTSNVVNPAGTNNGLSTPMPYDFDGDGLVDYIYAGDLQGNLWRFNVSDPDPTKWVNGGALYVAQDGSGNNQPITTAPMVTPHPKGGVMVLFGTGKYLETADVTSNSQQSFYGIWDKDGAATVSDRSLLTQQTITTNGGQVISGNDFRSTSDNCIGVGTSLSGTGCADDWTTKRGWYMDFPAPNPATNPGERIGYNPLLRNDRIVFPTLIPSTSPCLAGGSSWLMELDAITGRRMDMISPFDVNGDGSYSLGTLTSPPGGMKPWQGGIITTPTVIQTSASVPGAPGKANTTQEYKYASSSTGAVIKTPESVNKNQAGRITWREIFQ